MGYESIAHEAEGLMDEMHWFTVFITALCVIFLMKILKQLCYWVKVIGKIQLVVYHQCCVLIG